MPRFVLLYHECPPHHPRPSHWDLMLEVGESLRTWALARLPNAWRALQTSTAASNPGCPPLANEDSVTAEQLANHRLAYLDKEGPLSNDRGRVSRSDYGTYERKENLPGSWYLVLEGDNWRGEITLQQTAAADRQWTLTVHQRGR
ncbi:MAG: DNA polymerase ligase N-terminal domain-containing protein [Pirellulales bacterium]